MIEQKTVPTEPRPVYITHALGNLMRDWEANCSPENLQQIVKEVGEKFSSTQRKLSHTKPGPDRAKLALKMTQEAVDTSIDAEFSKTVSCKVGCSGCCHQQVEVSEDEGKLLAKLVENGVKVDQDKLRRMASQVYDDLAWWRLPKEEKACLFLGEDNKCRIYQHRPMACRKYFVFTPPEACSAVSAEGSIEVGVQVIPKAEIVASAVMDFVRGEGNIPQQLAKHLSHDFKMREWTTIGKARAQALAMGKELEFVMSPEKYDRALEMQIEMVDSEIRKRSVLVIEEPNYVEIQRD